MKISVLVKQVPDSDEVKMDPVKGTMVREGTGNIVNPLDLNAVEAALALKNKFGGDITALTMGPPQADIALREALALGVDHAYLLTDRAFAGADSWATSLALARAIEKLGPFDVILAGEKATDGETGQVGPEVAAMLGVPCATYVSRIESDGAYVTVSRMIEDGIEVQRIKTPCLITVINNINEPEMPTLAGKKTARRADVPKATAEDIGLKKEETGLNGSPTRVVKIDHPKFSRQTEFFRGKDIDDGIGRVVEILRDAAAI